jgi:hypothetical protein
MEPMTLVIPLTISILPGKPVTKLMSVEVPASFTLPPMADDDPPVWEVPANVPAKLRTEVKAGGTPKLLPAVLAQCMLEIANGATQVKLRPEMYAKLKQLCPDVAALLKLNRHMKQIRKKATYDVSPEARGIVKVAS